MNTLCMARQMFASACASLARGWGFTAQREVPSQRMKKTEPYDSIRLPPATLYHHDNEWDAMTSAGKVSRA